MLSIEEFKKCIEEFTPDGFALCMSNKAELFCNMDVTFKLRELDIMSINKLDMYSRVVYPLFLQRVIEGINRKAELNSMDYIIDIGAKSITIGQCHERGDIKTIYFSSIPIDQAKEQAIKYILEEIK